MKNDSNKVLRAACYIRVSTKSHKGLFYRDANRNAKRILQKEQIQNSRQLYRRWGVWVFSSSEKTRYEKTS